uniref:AAA+ ATPase domain-containing protein n=1 Tax=viral metagenome TaxID=1070528 RepID=A0A6C0KRU2_9ZZZZ
MKLYFSLFFFTNIVNGLISFKTISISKRKTSLKISDDYLEDISNFQKFKYNLVNENYNDMIQSIMDKNVQKILVDNDFKEMVTIDKLFDKEPLYNNFHLANINPIIIPNLVEKAADANTPIYFVDLAPESLLFVKDLFNGFISFTSYIIPLFFVISLLTRLSNGFGQNPFQMMPIIAKKQPEFLKPNISLAEWAGSPEVIDECKEIISYIENKEKFKEIGAEMPRGILLEGPPGTGKTLLAKAIASETNSSFISVSGSEFVELFVGMGASRVRDLFKMARENRPAIIFIDEIDAVGRQRGAGINMANDEREQTLNQMLYEMDGFNNNDDIVVMAATNRKDILDKALLRPGRFDRIIKVPVPDKLSREKILDVYLKKKKMEEPFDLSAIAELTDGFSGAELKNLINEASILSVRNNETSIKEKYIFDSFEKSLVGLIRKTPIDSFETNQRVSIHEIGHALLVLKFDKYFDFQKVSIQSTYNGAGGYTIFSEKPEIKKGGLYTKDIFKKRLIITMGGKAAESIYYGDENVSMGAVQDLKTANSLAKRMIGNFGMGDKLEVFYNDDISDDSNPFLGRSLAIGNKYSDYTREIMDKESLELVKEAYLEAKNILTNDYETFIEISNLLQNNTILYKKDVDNFVKNKNA